MVLLLGLGGLVTEHASSMLVSQSHAPRAQGRGAARPVPLPRVRGGSEKGTLIYRDERAAGTGTLSSSVLGRAGREATPAPS
jgi:hypothetical protein